MITGPQFSTYMGVDRIEAEHVTLALTNRKLVFLSGPEGVTVELAQWD